MMLLITATLYRMVLQDFLNESCAPTKGVKKAHPSDVTGPSPDVAKKTVVFHEFTIQ